MKLLNEFVEDYPLGHMVELAVSYSTNGKHSLLLPDPFLILQMTQGLIASLYEMRTNG